MIVYVYCEGQTEESFVNKVLAPYVHDNSGLFLRPIICETKRTIQQKFKGGLVKYEKAKKEIQKLCKGHPGEYVSTMLDFYAFPEDAPGMEHRHKKINIYERIEYVEKEIFKDIGCNNFIPNLMLHEFECLLFVRPDILSQHYQCSIDAFNSLKAAREQAETPEHIDDGKETAPSKRIIKAIPGYSKILSGTIVTQDIGIDNIRKECRHFSTWIDKLCSV